MARYKMRYSKSETVVADELQWLRCITGELLLITIYLRAMFRWLGFYTQHNQKIGKWG